MEIIEKRKSVRTYLDKPVEKEKVEKVVKAGNMAAKSGQVYFYVITNHEVLRLISDTAKNIMSKSGNAFLEKRATTPGFDPIYFAPAVIIVTIPSQGGFNDELGIANAACAGENMLLEATDFGLGSCYVVSPTLAFSVPEIRQRLGITDKEKAVCAILIGYTDNMKPHVPRPENPKNIKYIE